MNNKNDLDSKIPYYILNLVKENNLIYSDVSALSKNGIEKRFTTLA